MSSMNLTDWPVLRGVQPYILKSTRLVYVFGKNGEEALLVTHQDRVYGIGKNENGHLGLGDDLPRIREAEVKALSGRNVKGFTSGGHPYSSDGIFVIAYLQNGTVYEWGSIPGCEKPLLTPHEVQNIKHKVVNVACGISHCLALCRTGEVYSWGTKDRGKLGRLLSLCHSIIPDPTTKHLTADLVRGILDKKEAVKIACGAHFCVVVLKDDTVVTWGCNEFGQLGLKSTCPFVPLPSVISFVHQPKFLKLVCGPDYVFGLKIDKKLSFWGNNRMLRLSNTEVLSYQYDRPTKVLDARCTYCSNIVTSHLFSLVVVETFSGVVIYGENFENQTFSSAKDVFFHHKFSMCEPWSLPKHRRTHSDVLAYAFNDLEKSDLTIRVEEKEIYVHKFWLMIRSDFFAALIQNRSHAAESDSKVITVTGYTYEVIHTYLKFLYTDDLTVEFDLAIELFKLADEYVDDDLKIKCIEVITKEMTIEKVIDVYPLACKFRDAEKLMDLCVNLAAVNLPIVVNSPNFNWDADVSKQFLRQLAKKLPPILT